MDDKINLNNTRLQNELTFLNEQIRNNKKFQIIDYCESLPTRKEVRKFIKFAYNNLDKSFKDIMLEYNK